MLARVLAAVAAGLLASVLSASAAQAAPAPPAVTAVSVDDEITGMSWSAPAFQVACTAVGTPVVRVNCIPADSSQMIEPACYRNVDIGSGASAMVCTSMDENRAALADAGDPVEIAFGCSFADAPCATVEAMVRSQADLATGVIALALDQVSLNTDSYLFTAALGEWSWWQAAVLGVILIGGIIGITQAALSRKRDEVVGAIVRFVLAFPISQLALVVTGLLVDVVDDATMALVVRNDADNAAGAGLYGVVENLFWNGGNGNYLFAGTISNLIVVASIVLLFVLSFRNIALVALVAIAPVALMLLPVKGVGVQWALRWVSAVVALALTTPLTLGMIMLILRGIGQVPTLWSVEALPLGVGMIAVAFAPMAIFSLFSFVSGHAAVSLADSSGSSARRTVQDQGARLRGLLTRTPRAPRSPGSGGTGSSSRGAGGRPSRPQPTRGGTPKPPPTPGASPSGGRS